MGSSESLLNLRILVLALGESHHSGWWKSQFLSPTGISFLERIYPRSKFAAAVRSATRAALSVHDANIGKGEIFHLFRLSRFQERKIDQLLKDRVGEFEAIYLPILGRRAELMDKLQVLAGNVAVEDAVGPVKINGQSTDIIQTLAATYLFAFSKGTQIYPYFEEEYYS
jgi:hypothetical protein